eukprot:scaffold1954_cov268-Pinguiococcus_pyrenoidosus.AAC.225
MGKESHGLRKGYVRRNTASRPMSSAGWTNPFFDPCQVIGARSTIFFVKFALSKRRCWSLAPMRDIDAKIHPIPAGITASAFWLFPTVKAPSINVCCQALYSTRVHAILRAHEVTSTCHPNPKC